MSTAIDRVKGAIVRGVTAGILGNIVDSRKQSVPTPKLAPVSPTVINTLCDALTRKLAFAGLDPVVDNSVRQGLQGCRPVNGDSARTSYLKYQHLRHYQGLIDNMTKNSKSKNGQLSGRGDYTWKNFGRDAVTGLGTLGGTLGGAALGTAAFGPGKGTVRGGIVGSSIGSGIGSELGSAIFGRGAYTVGRNSIVKTGTVLSEGTEVPSFIDSNRFTRITHREFVQDIVVPGAPTAFNNTTFVINPGNATLFPWLSTIASCYQQYEIMGMVFMFKSTSTDFSTSGALGSVILSTNYDVLETAYQNKVIMENSQYAVSAKPSLSQMHAIECDPKLTSITTKYIRNPSSSATASQDARFYDHGLFELATVGLSSTAGQVLGELWVTYDIKLLKPEIVNSAFLLQGERINAITGVTKALIYGTSPAVVGAQYAAVAGNTLTFVRAGQYLIEQLVSGAGLVDMTETAIGLTFTQVQYVTSGVLGLAVYVVNVTTVGQTLSFDASASGAVASLETRIASYLSATG